MFNKGILAISIGFVLGISGCGGGSSEDKAQISTGTGYYVDSAVEGVKYICGASEGTTDPTGKFTFELNKDCTFYIGNIKLREVDKEILSDNVTIYETDKYRAQILQSLDSDGNPTNGITISDELVTALDTANITSLPTTEAETNVLLTVVETAGGTIVSQSDAQAHALKTLIIDRTLYPVGNNGENPDEVGENLYKSDGTVEFPDGGSGDYTIEGNKLFLEDGNEYYEFTELTTDYILFTDFDENGGVTRLYFEKEKAEAYIATLND